MIKVGLNLLFLEPGATGGMETYARGLVPLLPEAWPEAQFVAFAGRSLAAEWREQPWHQQISMVDLKVASATRVRRSAFEQALLPAVAARQRPQLLHSLSQSAPIRSRVPSVVTIHDLIYAHPSVKDSGLLAKGVAAIVPRVARSARRLITTSTATADELERLVGIPRSKIDVVPMGPGITNSATPSEPAELRRRLALGDGPLVLAVSARQPHKNLHRLIAAIAEVPEATLVLPGYAGPLDDAVRSEAARLGVSDRVKLCGWVSDADLEGLYRAAQCLVFPSLVEGFGLPVLEAMGRGLPVATSNCSAMPEVAGDAALLFDPESIDSIADAIRRLLGDEQLRTELSALGLQRAKQFSWQACAQGTVASYQRALGR